MSVLVEHPPGPPAEPVVLKMTSLYGHNTADKDKKILRHIIDHCSTCASYHEDNLRDLHSECTDPLCGYFYWYYRHFWFNHMLHGQTMDECSACENCSKLYKLMQAHSTECISHAQLTECCCLTLCHEMKKSQHLTDLGKTDREFIQLLEGSSHAVASHAAPSSQGSGNTSYPPTVYTSRAPHSLMHPNDFMSPGTVNNHTVRSGDQRMSSLQAMGVSTKSRSSAHLVPNGNSFQHQNSVRSHSSVELHCHANGYDNNCAQKKYSAMSPFGNHRGGGGSSYHYEGQYSEQSSAIRSGILGHHIQSDNRHCTLNGDTQVVNHDTRFYGCATTPSGLQQLATPPGDPRMNRQISSTSSGYGTGSSTGRQSVASIPVLSRDQSYSELSVDQENSLQVHSTPHRKSSAPGGFQESGTMKKLPPQQSRSLTNLMGRIPEYITSVGDDDCRLGSEHSRVLDDVPSQPSSLQRQDTDPGGKMVSGGLEASFEKSQYEKLMRRRMTTRQMAVEGSIESSPSPPVTKRPLQREESDVAGKSKIVLGGQGRPNGSNSITKESYDSIFKFQQQHGILSDASTRDKVIGKQKKEVAAIERLRRGTMSDVLSDFDTESSTSDIPGSSPLTSGDFSELDQDLTDQDDDKKPSAGEEEPRILEVTEDKMTVDEQVKMINRMKERMKPLEIHMKNVPRDHYSLNLGAVTERTKRNQGLSLPLDVSPPYTPPKPILAPTPGITTPSYPSSISDGASTLERLSNSTLREDDYYPSGKFGNDPMTLSSTDGSTLTGGSSEGGFVSIRRPSGQFSGRVKDATESVRSPNDGVSSSEMSSHAPESRNLYGRAYSPSLMHSPSTLQSERAGYSYYMEDDSRLGPVDYDAHSSPSPSPPPYVPGKYRLPSSKVQEMCKTVDDVKEKFQVDLLRIKREGQLVKQEIPDLAGDEQKRRMPGNWIYVDAHGDCDMMYRGQFSTTFPESNFPELEKKYYHNTLNEQFPETEKEVAKDVERRHLLRKHLLGKFHSGHAYREGVHWYRKTRLGKGGQAECFSIQDEQTKLLMALKEEKEDPKTLDEAYVCMKLSSLSNACSNIVDYYCAGILPKEHNLRKRMTLIQVFMEMMPTCLHAYLLENGPFRNEDLHHYGYQLFEALDYLHTKLRIIHCDIKPSNLLLDFTAQRIKLTDFGFSQILEQYTNEVQGDDNAGTLSYNPPEHYREKKCSFALDIWQAGCTLLTMATIRRPWRHLFMDVVRNGQSPQFVQAVRRGQAELIGQQTCGHMYPSFLDHSLKQLLHGCLHPDPKDRLSAQDCVYQLAMAGTSHMNDQQRKMITEAFGHWRSPPPVLSTYKRDIQYVDVYLESTRHAVVDHLRYSLSPGWLGRVPYREGMNFEQMMEDILQHFKVMQHFPFNLSTCENSPQAIFMKTAGHSVDVNFKPASPQSLVDRTKAIVIVDMCLS